MEKLASERVDLGEKVTSLQNQIYKGSEKMDQFKLLMNWNQEELEQWALAQRQKEEDNAALAKYRNQVGIGAGLDWACCPVVVASF